MATYFPSHFKLYSYSVELNLCLSGDTIVQFNTNILFTSICKSKTTILNKPLRLKSFGFAPNKHVITYFHSLFQYRIFCVLHTEEYSIVSFKENILYSRHRIFCVLHIEYFVSHTHHLCYFFCQHFYAELHHSWCHFGGLKEQIRFFA